MLTVPFCLDTLGDLVYYDSFSDGFVIFITNTQNLAPIPYRWSISSTAPADGVHVIRPTSISVGQPGRWIVQVTGTISRIEVVDGITDPSGNITVTWATPFTTIPHLSPVIQGGTANQFLAVSSNTLSGFTLNVKQRNSINLLGFDVLLSATVNISGVAVKILATEKL